MLSDLLLNTLITKLILCAALFLNGFELGFASLMIVLKSELLMGGL